MQVKYITFVPLPVMEDSSGIVEFKTQTEAAGAIITWINGTGEYCGR